MACNEFGGKLDLYLDSELSQAEATPFIAHLRGCSSCTADALERVQIKRALQIAGKRYAPSAQFRNKIAKNVAAKKRTVFDWRLRLAPVAALVVLVAAGLLYSNQQRESAQRQRLYSELADLHVSTMASATQVDVISTDRHTVKPWFQGRIPFTFNLPELQGSDFTLLGGRVTYLEQTSGAHLIFQIRKHEISAFIFPEPQSGIPSLPSGPVNRLSFNVESWTQNGLRYFVLGDASSEDIRSLSKLLQDAK